jgi:hypothetical protein
VDRIDWRRRHCSTGDSRSHALQWRVALRTVGARDHA